MDIRLVLPHHIKVIASCWSTFLKEGRTISELARTYFKTLLHYPIRLSRSVVISFQLSTTNPNHIDDAPVKRLLPDIYETRYRSLFNSFEFFKTATRPRLHKIITDQLGKDLSKKIQYHYQPIKYDSDQQIRLLRISCKKSVVRNSIQNSDLSAYPVYTTLSSPSSSSSSAASSSSSSSIISSSISSSSVSLTLTTSSVSSSSSSTAPSSSSSSTCSPTTVTVEAVVDGGFDSGTVNSFTVDSDVDQYSVVNSYSPIPAPYQGPFFLALTYNDAPMKFTLTQTLQGIPAGATISCDMAFWYDSNGDPENLTIDFQINVDGQYCTSWSSVGDSSWQTIPSDQSLPVVTTVDNAVLEFEVTFFYNPNLAFNLFGIDSISAMATYTTC